jgi:hypothetical protein
MKYLLNYAKLGIVVLLASQWCCHASVSAQTRYGKDLGRLLTSPSERLRLDDIRFNTPALAVVAEKPKVEIEPPAVLSIGGISNRPDRPAGQRISVWINGRPFAESDLPPGLTLVRNASGEVIGMNSKIGNGKTEFAKIGDNITRPQTAEEAKAAENLASKP